MAHPYYFQHEVLCWPPSMDWTNLHKMSWCHNLYPRFTASYAKYIEKYFRNETDSQYFFEVMLSFREIGSTTKRSKAKTQASKLEQSKRQTSKKAKHSKTMKKYHGNISEIHFIGAQNHPFQQPSNKHRLWGFEGLDARPKAGDILKVGTFKSSRGKRVFGILTRGGNLKITTPHNMTGWKIHH